MLTLPLAKQSPMSAMVVFSSNTGVLISPLYRVLQKIDSLMSKHILPSVWNTLPIHSSPSYLLFTPQVSALMSPSPGSLLYPWPHVSCPCVSLNFPSQSTYHNMLKVSVHFLCLAECAFLEGRGLVFITILSPASIMCRHIISPSS